MFRKITNISGAYCLKNFTALDNRGKFFKIFRHDQFPEEINSLHFRESFFTESKKNVLRGMHFQLPPYDLDKTATVISGRSEERRVKEC